MGGERHCLQVAEPTLSPYLTSGSSDLVSACPQEWLYPFSPSPQPTKGERTRVLHVVQFTGVFARILQNMCPLLPPHTTHGFSS